MADLVEICCPNCQSRFAVPWVQNSYAAVCMSCGKGIADLRPHLTQPPPPQASDSSKQMAAQAHAGRETATLAALVRESRPQNADGNAPTVFGETPVEAQEPVARPVSELETMKVPRDLASQPTQPLPQKPPSGRQSQSPESTAFQSTTSKLKLGRVGHSLTGETKIRRRERLERGKKKVFESWVAPPGLVMPAGNSGHFAPPTASASKTRAISYRDLRSSSSTAYLESLRAAAEAARVKKGISQSLMPRRDSSNEVKELERFLEEAERMESARQAAVSAAVESPTLGNLTFSTNATAEVVLPRDDPPEPLADLPKAVSEGALPPAAAQAAAAAAKAVAPAPVKSVAELEEENDPGARRVSTRSIVAKQTEVKARARPKASNAGLGFTLVEWGFYALLLLIFVAFVVAVVNQYFIPLGLPRL